MNRKLGFLLFCCLLPGFHSAHSSLESASFFQGGSGPSKKVYSGNPEANALYIQGLEYLGKGRPWAGGSLLNADKALKLFRQAAQKDPQFALAYLGQADALNLFYFSVSGGLTQAKLYRRQEAAALKAAELDDSLPQAHSMLARIYHESEYDWPKAEKELKRVIELTPSASGPHASYGLFLGTMGRFEEAEAQIKLAQAMNEKSPWANLAMMQLLYWQRKDEAALAQGLEALRKDDSRTSHFFLGFVYIHMGQFEKGIAEEKLASGIGDAGSLAGLAYAYAMADDKEELQKTLERFKHHPGAHLVPYRLAAVYVALGDKDRAMSLIEKDYRQRNNWLNNLKVDPIMDPLRREPRFQQLMRKMNFEQ